jgi:hypothetical protein
MRGVLCYIGVLIGLKWFKLEMELFKLENADMCMWGIVSIKVPPPTPTKENRNQNGTNNHPALKYRLFNSFDLTTCCASVD